MPDIVNPANPVTSPSTEGLPQPFADTPLIGSSETGTGVTGESNTGVGVRGVCTPFYPAGTTTFGPPANDGVFGSGSNGVHGTSYSGNGVLGENSAGGPGVMGTSASGYGVHGVGATGSGMAPGGCGIFGESANNIGVVGSSTNNNGVLGSSTNNHGVHGINGNGAGTGTTPPYGCGVYGETQYGIGVYGASSAAAYAGYFNGQVYVNGNHTVTGTQTVGNQTVTGNVTVAGDVTLTGADCAERFDLDASAIAESGTVMVIGEDGALRPSDHAYDRRVAGVVSGAGAFRPGIVLDKRVDDRGRTTIALVGKAYCKVDADVGPIEVGDLLTTSNTPGHAMRVADPRQAFGAVIGKALRPLPSGLGLLPILIALQ